MPIIKRTATSKEMQKNYNVVKNMSGGMQFDENMSNVNWKQVRLISNIGYSFMPKEKGVKFRKVNLNGINAVLSTPTELETEGIVLYIHGGGLVAGSAKGTKGYCSMLAHKIGCRVFSIDYRLAPEHKFPDALDDCYKAYTEIQKMYPNVKIALSGESGGAYLCFQLIVRCLKMNTELPACVIVHSGLFDLSGELEKNLNLSEVDDITVKIGAISAIRNLYAPDMDYRNPELSPLQHADFSQFPPAVFTCDSKETLKSESHAMYKKYTEAGVEAILYEYENTFHAFAPIGTSAPETTELLEENGAFIRKYIG